MSWAACFWLQARSSVAHAALLISCQKGRTQSRQRRTALVGEAYIVAAPPECQHRFPTFLIFFGTAAKAISGAASATDAKQIWGRTRWICSRAGPPRFPRAQKSKTEGDRHARPAARAGHEPSQHQCVPAAGRSALAPRAWPRQRAMDRTAAHPNGESAANGHKGAQLPPQWQSSVRCARGGTGLGPRPQADVSEERGDRASFRLVDLGRRGRQSLRRPSDDKSPPGEHRLTGCTIPSEP